jgi:hypothetical protein
MNACRSRTTSLSAWSRVFACSLSLVVAAAAHGAQPDNAPAPRRDGPQGAMRAIVNEQDPQRAKRMLEELLTETRNLERDLSDALDRMNKGDAPRDVLRELGDRRAVAREGMRDRVGDRPRPGNGARDMRDLRDGPQGEAGPAGPQGRRPGDRFVKPGGFAKLTQQERDQLREDFRRELPDVAADLEALRSTNRDMAEGIFSRIAPRYFEAREIRRTEPQLADLRIVELRGTVDVLRKTKAYREAVKLPASDATRATAITQSTADLRAAIAKNFDERLAVQKYEADSLAQRLDELRADIARKGERKDSLVDDALDRMVRGLPPQPERPPTDRPPPPAP